ncbi:MAG: type I restriction endonuclease subunit R [Acidimicrobiia bacterium]
MSSPNEALFEDAITAHLAIAGGYLPVKWGNRQDAPRDFDATRGLDTAELFAFIGATQPDEWSALVKAHGGDPDRAQRLFADRLASQLDERGTVDLLRHGVVDHGVTIRLAFFKPAHGLTPELVARYAANRLTVTRQLPYDSGSTKTLDLALFVNGIPVATAELKNPLTGQGVEEAKEQYRRDRDPKNVTLGRRAVVHFAVDPSSVAMSTKLAGSSTRFLPFNLGHDGRAGNPPNPGGHRTAYLWEQVWERDAWMDLLARFVHVTRPDKGTPAQKRAAEAVIFPRYHQWDAVRSLEADARINGSGSSYLVQHSAGSGKSNTIAWTAHRLSSLHDGTDTKVFDKVVVITDRVVLDRQLQETIYQFEHARGVVVKIDQNSQQLADALAGEQARIIITTLQKFPFVLDKIAGLPARRYAVIVDEAHSSQTGEAAKDLRLALGADDEVELTAAEAEDAGYGAEAEDPVETALAKAVAARGRQKNMSFFAFTATPKARTMELFGTWNATEKRFEPFHLYSMRQAIDEGFILDVLANYTTYKTYWRIEKAIADDPAYETHKARQAIARFVSLHPYSLAQKAEIIVEHFRRHTAAKIGGRAKAMVVTSSRLHAVRYKQSIDKYLVAKGYTDLAALVAFSGKVIADDGEFTEHGMNHFPEAETADRFDTDDYQVMIVAEKFQTGFDQPLLHTMYVDKPLSGLATVQTLSRLNRIAPGKTDTFVLDFRNDTDDIVKAFEPYYGRTVAPPTDPNLLWDTRHRLDGWDVLRPDEVETAVAVLVTLTDAKDHGTIYALLDPAVERFRALHEEDRLGFKDALDKFVRTYSFLSQVVSFGDTKLERDYGFCRALAAYLRDQSTVERLDLGTEIELTHLRTEITFEGSLALDTDTGEVKSVFGDGRGKAKEPDVETLSQIVEVLNERFGLQLGEADQLLFDQFETEWLNDPDLAAQANANTLQNFRHVFDPKFMTTVVTRMDANEAIFKQILDDPDFRNSLADFYLAKVYQRLRREAP